MFLFERILWKFHSVCRLWVCSRLPLHSTMRTLHIVNKIQHWKSRIMFTLFFFFILVSCHKTCTATLDDQNWTLRSLHDSISVCVFSSLPKTTQSEKYYASKYRMTDLQPKFLFLGNVSPKMVFSATWLRNFVTFSEFMVFSSVAFGIGMSCQTQGWRGLRLSSRARVEGLPPKLGRKPRHELQN